MANQSRKEITTAERSYVSSSNLEQLSKYLTLPSKLKGARILDIGTGTSSAVQELREKGATAIGFDYRYQYPAHKLQAELDRFCKALKPDTLLESHHRIMGNKFFKLYKQGNRPFVSGLASALPFANDSFDLVYSSGLFSTVFIEDYELFHQAMNEALRVLKPGRTLQIVPWELRGWESNFRISMVVKRVESTLQSQGLPYQIEKIANHNFKNLKITKPS